jgi:hypothetical protein
LINSLSGTVATIDASVTVLQSQVTSLIAQAHDAVTLGNANGLSLSGQILSLALASSTSTGALSAFDWDTFNNKINYTSLSAT